MSIHTQDAALSTRVRKVRRDALPSGKALLTHRGSEPPLLALPQYLRQPQERRADHTQVRRQDCGRALTGESRGLGARSGSEANPLCGLKGLTSFPGLRSKKIDHISSREKCCLPSRHKVVSPRNFRDGDRVMTDSRLLIEMNRIREVMEEQL